METLILLALSTLLIVPLVGLVFALLNHRRLNEQSRRFLRIEAHQIHRQDVMARLTQLERRLAALEADGRPAVAVATEEPVELPDPSEIDGPAPSPRAVVAEQPVPTPSPAAQPKPAPPSPAGTVDDIAAVSRRARSWLEADLVTRLGIVVGAVALTLAGVFLVKYWVERGLLGPLERVALGVAFGLILAGVGEWLRTRAAGIAQGLTAAGVAVLFAALLAGTNLYDLIPPMAGFALMAVTTAAAVFLSMRQGPLVAVLGLVGGFLTPFLVGAREPRPGLLFVYLFLLQAGLLVVSRRMRWMPLALLTLAGGMGSTALYLVTTFGDPSGRPPAGLFVLSTVGLFVLTAHRGEQRGDWGASHGARILSWAAVCAGLVVLSGLVGSARLEPVEWMFLAVLGGGSLVLARLDEGYEGLAWLSAAAAACLLWLGSGNMGPDELTRYAVTALLLGLLFACGSFVALWGSRAPHRWAVFCAVSGVVFTLVAYLGLHGAKPLVPWGVVCVVEAAVYGLFAWAILRRRGDLALADVAVAAMLVAVTSLLSLAAPIELDRAWIAVAWALEIPALAWIGERLRVPALRRLSWVLGGAVCARLLLNPAVLFYPIGESVVWNWLLYGYGLPILALAAAVVLYRRSDARGLARALESAALALGLALLTLLVRHGFHTQRMLEGRFELVELASYTVVWTVFGLALLAADRRFSSPFYRWTGVGVGGAACVQALMTQVLASNPLIVRHAVGDLPVLNALLWVYGAPAALAGLTAWMLYRAGEKAPARFFGVFGLAMSFLLVTLEVRQAFHGSLLHGSTSSAELYAYSVAWILFSAALLAAGIAFRNAVSCYSAAPVLLLAVGKVFFIDTASLEGLYRVLSLLGLGVSLMILAYVYQRFVFPVLRAGRTG